METSPTDLSESSSSEGTTNNRTSANQIVFKEKLKQLCQCDKRLHVTTIAQLLKDLLIEIPEDDYYREHNYVDLVAIGIRHLEKNRLTKALEYFQSGMKATKEPYLKKTEKGKDKTKVRLTYFPHAFLASGITNILLQDMREAIANFRWLKKKYTTKDALLDHTHTYCGLLKSLSNIKLYYPKYINQELFDFDMIISQLEECANSFFVCYRTLDEIESAFYEGLDELYESNYHQACCWFEQSQKPMIIEATGWNSRQRTLKPSKKKIILSIAYLAEAIARIKMHEGDAAEIQLKKAIKLASRSYDYEVAALSRRLLSKITCI